MTCPHLRIDSGGSAEAADGARLLPILVRQPPSPLQRTDGDTVQRAAVSDRHRAPRRLVAPALQAQAAGRCRVARATRQQHLVRDSPRLGVPHHAADKRSTPGTAWRSGRSLVVHRRDVREGCRSLVRPVPAVPSALRARRQQAPPNTAAQEQITGQHFALFPRL